MLEHYGVISYKVKKSSHGSAELVIFEFCYEDLRYCSGVDNESVQICGGNECIRSSTACHLIIPFKGSYVCGGHHDTYRYNSYEQANSIKKMPASNKQTTLWVADTLSWLLHFTRKFNLAIQSRFPDFRIITSFPLLILSYNGISKSRSSVTVTGSLRILT